MQNIKIKKIYFAYKPVNMNVYVTVNKLNK